MTINQSLKSVYTEIGPPEAGGEARQVPADQLLLPRPFPRRSRLGGLQASPRERATGDPGHHSERGPSAVRVRDVFRRGKIQPLRCFFFRPPKTGNNGCSLSTIIVTGGKLLRCFFFFLVFLRMRYIYCCSYGVYRCLLCVESRWMVFVPPTPYILRIWPKNRVGLM